MNRRTVTAFYDPMFNQCQPAEAVEKYVGDVYIQHNPMVAEGKQAFIATSFGWHRNTQEGMSNSNG